MRCSTVKKNVSALRDGELEAKLAQELEAHLADCAACAELAASYAGVDAAMEALPQPEPSASFDEAFRAKLSAARNEQAEISQQSKGRRWLTIPLFAGAAATVAAVVLAVVLSRPAGPPAGDTTAVSDVTLAQHLDLLQNYEVVQNLDVLEDFEAVVDLEALLEEEEG